MSSSSSSSIGTGEAGGRGLWLRRFAQRPYRTTEAQGFRMAIAAYGASRMSDRVFRYIRRPYNPITGVTADELDGVCSPADLEEFPEDAPNPADNPAWFRRASVDLVVRSQAEAEELWSGVVKELTALVAALDFMDVVVPELDVAIGDPPAAGTPPTP